MIKSTRSKAEAQFTATQKKAKQALKERDKERQDKAEHTAKLRALRLAKEAADAAAIAGPGAADAVAAGSDTAVLDEDTPRLPQVHRRQS